jgi:hypothetical protein
MANMESFDAWDNIPGSKRKNRRYHARWKVMLVFGSASNIPNFQSLIHDLSLTGMSVQYHSEVKVHAILTLLLALPPKEGAPRKVIKLQAEVLSTIPFHGGFRLGMRFIRDAELDKFRPLIGNYIASEDSLYSDPDADDFPKLNL